MFVCVCVCVFVRVCVHCRQRKDELEQRMSSLQESRRELMVQLEGLMKLLKVTHTHTHRLLVVFSVVTHEGKVSLFFLHTSLCLSSQ